MSLRCLVPEHAPALVIAIVRQLFRVWTVKMFDQIFSFNDNVYVRKNPLKSDHIYIFSSNNNEIYEFEGAISELIASFDQPIVFQDAIKKINPEWLTTPTNKEELKTLANFLISKNIIKIKK